MNYEKIYNYLIEIRRVTPAIGDTELHHIIPKCVGGSDESENLVKLSKREHRFVHLLLPKIYKDSRGLKVSANLFSHKRLKYPTWNKGIPMEKSQREKLSHSKKGKSLSKDHRNAIKVSAPRKTKIIVFNDRERFEFESVKEAARFLMVPYQNIFRVLRKIRKSLKGYNIVHG